MPRRQQQRVERDSVPPALSQHDRNEATTSPGGHAQQVDALRAEDRGRGSRSLDAGVESQAGPDLGRRFDDVRIFPESRSADALGARAYADGNEIFFGRGRYAPQTAAGRELLGHELTHVTQQRGRGPLGSPAAAEAAAEAGGRAFAAGRPGPGQPSAAPGVQFAPLSHTDLFKRKMELQEKLKQPDLPQDEKQRLQTELAGVEKSLVGGDHDPNTYEGAAFIVTQAATLVSVDNTNGKWSPWDLPPVPPAYGVMLFDFWKARSGYDFAGGKQVEIRGKARRDHLQAGLATLQPLLNRVLAGGDAARAWVEQTFMRDYRRVDEETYFDEARELIDQTVAQGSGATGAQPVPKIVAEDEQIRGAAITGRETLSRLLQTYTRFAGGDMERELAKAMAQLDTGAKLPDALKGVNSMKFTQAAYYLYGVLNAIDAIYTLEKISDREEMAKRYPNIFATTTDMLYQTTRILQGTVVLTAGLTGTLTRLAGLAEDATMIFQVGSRSLRTIGTIGSAFQVLYGFSVLLDPNATAEQRRGAIFNIGLGGAGIGSLPALWGGTRLWASGPWTVAVIWGGLVYQYQRALRAGMTQGWLTFAMRYSFESLQIRAERLSEYAKPLSVALFALKHLDPGSAPDPEASLHGGMESVVRIETGNVRDQIERLVDLTTRRSDWFLEREPGDFAEFKQRFLPLKDLLAQAKSPEDVLALALHSLEVVRTAFQESDQIFLKTLKAHMP